MEASLELEKGVGQHPSVVIHREPTLSQPRRGATARAEEGCVLTGVCDAVNVSATQDGLGAGVELLRTGLHFQCAMGPTSTQGQRYFDAGWSCTNDAKGFWIFRVLQGQKVKGLFQRFDRDAREVVGVTRHRTDIEAEHTEAQWWPLVKEEMLALGINTNDFGLHKGHPSSIAEVWKVDTQLVSPIDLSDQAWDHA